MTRVFRLFISSTFQDWSPEREYLRAYVFPRLQKLCEDKGGRFLPVDLRWGISEEAGNTHDTVGICLEEIERCQRLTPKPNFLVLLGNRYGWRPVPATISKSQWDKLCELKIIQDESLWTKWYQLDKNSCERTFYPHIFQPELRYQLDENSCKATYILRAKDDNWEEDERELRKQLDHLVEKDHSFTENELTFLVGSVTEQEIVRGALAIPNASEHVYAFERVFSNDVEHASYTDFSKGSVDEFASQSLQGLKMRLSKYLGDNYHTLPKQDFDTSWMDGERPVAYLEKLGAQVFESLSRVIKQEFESCEAEEFISPDTAYFVGRSDELKVMNQRRSHPLMVFGNPGSGKSTLLSHYVQELTNKGAQVLSFWVGRNPECATGAGFLRILLREIQTRQLVLDEFQWGDYSVAGVIESSELLKRALSNLKPESSNFVVIIDAVDQWGKDDPARDLNWMPYNGQFICSSLDNEQRKYFISQFGDASILPLDVLSRDDAKTLLDSWLNRDRRKLQDKQKTLLIDAFDGMPLHLRILYEAAKGWHSYDDTPDNLPNSTDTAIERLYERWSSESEHGATMAQRTLAYLTAAPNGLSESELLTLLRLDEHIVASFRHRSPQSPSIDALPEIIWSRLFHDLEPFLAERHIHGELLFDFYHMQFRRVAEKWIDIKTITDCHSRTASLMLNLWGCQGEKANHRLLHILPKLLFDSDNSYELFNLAENTIFLESQKRINASLPLDTLGLAVAKSIEGFPASSDKYIDLTFLKGRYEDIMRNEASPLKVLNNGYLHRAIYLIEVLFKEEDRLLWFLLLEFNRWCHNDSLAQDIMQNKLVSLELNKIFYDSDSDIIEAIKKIIFSAGDSLEVQKKLIRKYGCYKPERVSFKKNGVDKIKELVKVCEDASAKKLAQSSFQGAAKCEAYCVLCVAWIDRGDDVRVIDVLNNLKSQEPYLAGMIAAFLGSYVSDKRGDTFIQIALESIERCDISGRERQYKECFSYWINKTPEAAEKALEKMLLARNQASATFQLGGSFQKLVKCLQQLGFYRNAINILNKKGNTCLDERELAICKLGLPLEEIERILDTSNTSKNKKQKVFLLLQEIEEIWLDALRQSGGIVERLPWQILRIGHYYLIIDEVDLAKKWLKVLAQIPRRKFAEEVEIADKIMSEILQTLLKKDYSSEADSVFKWYYDGWHEEKREMREFIKQTTITVNKTHPREVSSFPYLERHDLDKWIELIKKFSVGDMMVTNTSSLLDNYLSRMDFTDFNKVRYMLNQLTGSVADGFWACIILIYYFHKNYEIEISHAIIKKIEDNL